MRGTNLDNYRIDTLRAIHPMQGLKSPEPKDRNGASLS